MMNLVIVQVVWYLECLLRDSGAGMELITFEVLGGTKHIWLVLGGRGGVVLIFLYLVYILRPGSSQRGGSNSACPNIQLCYWVFFYLL